MDIIYLAIPLASLLGAILAGFMGKAIGRAGSHIVTIAGVGTSFLLSLIAFNHLVFDGGAIYNETVYTWMVSGGLRFEVGFLIDQLTVMMMCVVTGVSLMVHIYTIGYMKDDPGYQRFFSYISLFTFSMLMLVMSNNLMQLFFGWEAVGLVSYLLIGFWYKKDTAIYANMKAFLVNRVGDFGFILGIAAVVMYSGSLDYKEVFAAAPEMSKQVIDIGFGDWSVMTVICILLFIGAMGKSAQVPLHVWLPDSMEGPTPISALIHAATMVTAGIFMVARMSPLYELSTTALTFIMFIGAITALFMGFIGIVQNDIKRVVAYSTLSQLGYMTVALGVSAYSTAVFHLMTHAFFKALLFLGAGSVIIAMHHEQDMRKMGGLRKYMPITWITSLVGSLALIGFPGFSGFFSKDSIIIAVGESNLPGAWIVHIMVLAGVFVTAFYSFRMYFLVFHGKERMDEHTRKHLHETPLVVTLPLIALAIPSVIIGWWTIEPMLFSDFFESAMHVGERGVFHGEWAMIQHGLMTLPFYLAALGVGSAWYIYMKNPQIADTAKQKFSFIYTMLDKKYWIDELYVKIFSDGSRALGKGFWKAGDVTIIDGLLINGSAKIVGWFAGVARQIQTGMLYHYAFAMILGLVGLLYLFVKPF
ncbi:NADH-ubiquinone oxidoreductase chain L [hydrothermal vent metagenome]|uniref:NADH-ubiquinone oxidoreductase chain L n=1 Tax=hydrothermal vent metagenome TaxID=652676 RepID=A0A3B0Y1M2_9ZZZZ